MHTVVTGAGGFVGAALVQRLRAQPQGLGGGKGFASHPGGPHGPHRRPGARCALACGQLCRSSPFAGLAQRSAGLCVPPGERAWRTGRARACTGRAGQFARHRGLAGGVGWPGAGEDRQRASVGVCKLGCGVWRSRPGPHDGGPSSPAHFELWHPQVGHRVAAGRLQPPWRAGCLQPPVAWRCGQTGLREWAWLRFHESDLSRTVCGATLCVSRVTAGHGLVDVFGAVPGQPAAGCQFASQCHARLALLAAAGATGVRRCCGEGGRPTNRTRYHHLSALCARRSHGSTVWAAAGRACRICTGRRLCG
jgi:hypothetical protein